MVQWFISSLSWRLDISVLTNIETSWNVLFFLFNKSIPKILLTVFCIVWSFVVSIISETWPFSFQGLCFELCLKRLIFTKYYERESFVNEIINAVWKVETEFFFHGKIHDKLQAPLKYSCGAGKKVWMHFFSSKMKYNSERSTQGSRH